LFNFTNGGKWYSEFSEEDWRSFNNEDFKNRIIKNDFLEGSDKRQEIVFIGCDFESEKLEMLLDECLLTDEELEYNEKYWNEMEDPFHLKSKLSVHELVDNDFNPKDEIIF
jgi:hypothetical protein